MGEDRVRRGTFGKAWAVLFGVMIAVAAMTAFGYWLHGFIDERGREEVEALARRTIALADTRIVSALASLDQLAMQDVESCGSAQLTALRKAAFSNPWVKDMAVLGADGRILCGSFGPSLAGGGTVLSSFHPNGEIDLSIAIIRVAGTTMLSVSRHVAGAAGLAALIPAAIFVTQVSREGTNLKSKIRITASDGTPIVEGGGGANDLSDADAFMATRQSSRYGLKAMVELPRAAMHAASRRMDEIVATVGGAILVLIVLLVWLLPRRRVSDPILELEQAIAANEFIPYYQPIVDVRTGRLRGAEVLIRWRKPDGSIITPAAFIPLAESTSLIVPLTRALMRRVCEEVGAILGCRPDLKIGFNLAALHFVDDAIVGDVREIFSNSPISLSQVVLEVTERQPLENLGGARRVIAGLQELGCGVAIDDVGTGHGGLSYMLKLGADTIKIDKLFVDAIGSEHQSTIILETLVDLARNMRMEVVAEGVENFEQVMKLRDLGILAAQGHVFCPPLPGSSFVQLVEAIAPLTRNMVEAIEAAPFAALPAAAAA